MKAEKMTTWGKEGEQLEGIAEGMGEASGRGDELEASMMTHVCENVIIKLITLEKT